MFADAYEIARQFTHPVALLRRDFSGDSTCGLGAFVVLNEDGWALTAKHILQHRAGLDGSKRRYLKYQQALVEAGGEDSLSDEDEEEIRAEYGPTEQFTTAWAEFWGGYGIQPVEAHVHPKIDLAVVRLEPFRGDKVGTYPQLREPDEGLRPGTSLCRIGFPLHEFSPKYNEDTDQFDMTAYMPFPIFPIEGIYTRNLHVSDDPDGGYPLYYLETSRPGLKGQSGGPIVDTDGCLWAIQAVTDYYQLGFAPEVEETGTKEHQFLGVGLGVHTATICGFLGELGIHHHRA